MKRPTKEQKELRKAHQSLKRNTIFGMNHWTGE